MPLTYKNKGRPTIISNYKERTLVECQGEYTIDKKCNTNGKTTIGHHHHHTKFEGM